MKSRLVLESGEVKIIDTEITEAAWGFTARIDKKNIHGVSYVDFMFDYFNASVGEEGFFVTNHEKEGTYLTRFTERQDMEVFTEFSYLGCFGFSRKADGILGIVTTLRCDFGMVLGIKDGRYYTWPRFLIDGDVVDEDIEVEYHFLNEPGYSGEKAVYP